MYKNLVEFRIAKTPLSAWRITKRRRIASPIDLSHIEKELLVNEL